MADSLRDFVYINEDSLNSNLSSLGRGVLEEITEESGSEKQTGGKGSVGAPSLGLGASGDHHRLNTENVTSTLRVLAPYRFNSLESLVETEDIPVFDGTEGSPPSRSDTIEISGEVSAMSLFKLESALGALDGMMGGETMDTLDELGDEDLTEDVSPNAMRMMGKIQDVVSQFTGSAIPLRMSVNGYPFAIPLHREFMRTSAEDEFLSERQYTVFGRVERNITSEEEWDPVTLTRILDKDTPQEQSGQKLRADMKEWAAEMNISMERDDMLIDGPASILHPIAVYW